MDKELKKRWVAALRSGEYNQGRYTLRSRDGFCCMGVLCDLIDPEGWEEPVPGGFLWRGNRVHCPLVASLAPIFVQLNDKSGCSFEEIADYIDKNVEVDDG